VERYHQIDIAYCTLAMPEVETAWSLSGQ